MKSSASGALANKSEYDSHDTASMPPLGSTSLTPFSCTGLCEAVIINPVIACVQIERNAASTPMRKIVDGSNVASVRKPAVPYENFTPAP